MTWQIVSIIIAFLSLCVNFFQYLKNKKLSNTVNKLKQSAGGNIDTSEQRHSGKGDNYNIKGDTSIKK